MLIRVIRGVFIFEIAYVDVVMVKLAAPFACAVSCRNAAARGGPDMDGVAPVPPGPGAGIPEPSRKSGSRGRPDCRSAAETTL